ncbi:HAD-IB family phosphatase [Oleiagrimonas sp. MCCC 1A03011]|uniref:HAD-IB family phosphatase n=1 Tax=Oleiagrimonas sp. MCCC 1A03011 TaxID=1926883 RepID=UPI000DC4B960|nr:HAD-IB family phosphatase [Oleiagrimonas sp. MCCC 1A03011]RAP59675.1 hydrolase [Oleiagrimonas sp. MCCC 1A03011]
MPIDRPPETPDLALFDFDGTLTVRETFADFMRAATPSWRRYLGGLWFGPMYAGYKAGWVSGSRIRAEVVRFGFRGLPANALRAAGEAFARNVLPTRLDMRMMQRLDDHRRRGDVVAVVSGALDVYLQPWCAQHGLPVICSRLQVVDRLVTGRYEGAQCVGEEKARRVRAAWDLSSFGEIHAYGDTAEDHAMLALAHRAYFRGRLMGAVGARTI